MQSKRNMCSQFRLLVSKLEKNVNLIRIDRVGEVHTNFQRILFCREIIRCYPILQGRAASLKRSSGEVPRFGTEEPVVTAFDFAAPVKTVSVFKAMEIVTHHRCMIRPALSGS